METKGKEQQKHTHTKCLTIDDKSKQQHHRHQHHQQSQQSTRQMICMAQVNKTPSKRHTVRAMKRDGREDNGYDKTSIVQIDTVAAVTL